MKKTLSLILAVLMLLLPFPSCSKEGSVSPSVPSKPDAADSGEAGPAETEWPTPDYSDFVMPEETEELVLYVMDDDFDESKAPRRLLDAALAVFREKYPGVAIDCQVMGQDEFEERIRAEIPAGKGPDLLYDYAGILIPDIFKAMAAGSFLDLGGYMEADPEFDRSDCMEGVLDGGLFQGKQFIVPTAYEMPILITTQEILDEEGIGADELDTWEGFYAALTRYCENHPESFAMVETKTLNPNDINLRYFWKHGGIRMVDYENYTADLDEENLKIMLDFCRGIYREDYEQWDVGWSDYTCERALLQRDCLFNNHIENVGLLFYNTLIQLREAGETPVVRMMPDTEGGVRAHIVSYCAVPSGAKNKLNAWRFLKLMLSDIEGDVTYIESWGLQIPLSNTPLGVPVNKAALRQKIVSEYERYFGPMDDDTANRYYDDMISATSADMIPEILTRYFALEMTPYIRGERSWEDCYKRFLNTLELYASE